MGLKRAISKGKVLGGKKQWRQETFDKTSDETIKKTYAEYKQHELNKKGEKTGKALGKHIISLYWAGIYQRVKIGDVKKLQQDIHHQ